MNIKLRHHIKQANHETLSFEMDIRVAPKHTIVGFFGRSGAGKTTILKILAGLVKNAQCELEITPKISNGHRINTQGRHNPCVYVGSDSPLFEHLSVKENLILLIRHSQSRQHDALSLSQVIDLCGISSLLSQFPWQLSSGEKQRVCFARALLTGKKILLLDEAFSALDWTMRQVMHLVLKQLVANNGYRAIMVSHSLQELSLCVSELITINQGKVLNQLPINAAIEQQIENGRNTQNIDNKTYFSSIKAVFSHVDEQDPSLHVWLLDDAVENCQSLGDKGQSLGGKSQEDECRLYVKAQTTNNEVSLNNEMVRTLLLPKKDELRSFVLNADQVSVSRDGNNHTSMVNCFEVVVQNIIQSNNGVMISGSWKQQKLRASITLKSYKVLNIAKGDKLYFVCKAL